MARYWIGTSGWSYPNWKGSFYPPGLKQGDWLEHYGKHFGTVELNASFYRLPSRAFIERWVERTPPGFLFALKAWRSITHNKRLNDCASALALYHEVIEGFGDKAGPVLYQLPPRLGFDPERLERFLALLPAGRRAAMEFRDPSWHRPETLALLGRFNVAFCPFELGEQVSPRAVTADFVYARLHGDGPKPYFSRYEEPKLADWAAWLGARLAEGRDAYLYFDNTALRDDAVANALRLRALLD